MSKVSETLKNLEANTGSSRSAWDAIMRQGVIAQIHIGRYRFEQRLDLGDLGVSTRNTKEARALESQVRTGVKLLLPPEYDRAFRSIESAARHTLTRNVREPGQGRIYAFTTPFGPFVPVTAFGEWKEKVDEYQKRYEDQRDELLKNYEDIIKKVMSDYYSIATGTYERLRRFNPALVSEVTGSTFVRRYRDRIREGFPTKEEVEASFYFRTSLTLLVLPEDLREKISDAAIQDEEDKARLRMLRQMKNEVSKSMMDDLRTFTATVDEQLYALLLQVADEGHKAASGGKPMRAKTFVMLRNLVEQVRMLNFSEHSDLAKATEAIEEAVSNYVVHTDKTGARRHLVGALDSARVLADRRLTAIGTLHKRRRDLVGPDGGFTAVRRQRKEVEEGTMTGIEPSRRRQRTLVG